MVDGVALVVAEAVGDEGDEAFVYPVYGGLAVGAGHALAEYLAVGGVLLHELADGADGELHDLDVCLLVVPAHVVDLSVFSFADYEVDGLAVVFDVEPVAHVTAVAVDGELFPFEYVVDDERYELFGEVVGAVVVGAAGDGDGHLVGVPVGHDHEVCTRLGGAVGAVGAEGGLFGEVAFRPEASVDLVGGNLVVAYAGAPGGVAGSVLARDPGAACGVEKVLRAEDIRLQEQLGVLDAPVDVALGGEVHDVVKLVLAEELVGKLAVADVSLDEEAAFVVDVFGYGAEVSGVGEGVEHDDAHVAVLGEDVFQIVGADESGGSGD